MDEINEVKKRYDNNVEDEWDRHQRHFIEFEINKRYIYKYVNKGDRILDIGGGPGRYSLDLAQNGCDVTLLDLSQGNIDFAAVKAVEAGLDIKTICGDARYADTLVSGTFDAVLLMGPLYHLTKEDDRVKAVEAALKLLKPGGYIFAAFISSYAAVWDYLTHKPEAILDPSEQKHFEILLKDESYSGMTFTYSHLIRPRGVNEFMDKFPVQKLHLVGSQSILATREEELMKQPKQVLDSWLDFAAKICEREEFLGMSYHFLYVGKKGL